MVNLPLFRGNTSRSVQRCFPKHRGTEPIPNELSMLIFYLQTRPGKIPKVVLMLTEKSAAALKHSRFDEMLVCVQILHEIVVQLAAHCGLYAKGAVDAMSIFLTAQGSGSDDVFVHTAAVFTDYNRVHRGVLFNGYPGFAQHFLDVVKQFTKAAAKPGPKQIPALKTLSSLGHSPASATVCGRQALEIALEGILPNIASSDAKDAAMAALTAFIDTPSLAQTSTVIKKLILFIGAQNNSALLTQLQSVVPKPNRFCLCVCLVQTLQIETASEPEILARSAMLSQMLRNADSKVGLSAIDVLRALLKVQHTHLNSEEVLTSLRDNIGWLAATATYPGQSGDLTCEILMSLKRGPERDATAIECDLLNILKVMDLSSPGDRKLPAAAWQNTFEFCVGDSRIAQLYSQSFCQFMRQGRPGHSISVQRGRILGQELCQQLKLDDKIHFTAENYCAIYLCLAALVETMGPDCSALLSVLVDAFNVSNRSRTVVLAVCKQVLRETRNDAVIDVDWPAAAQTGIEISMPPESKHVPRVDEWGVQLEPVSLQDSVDSSQEFVVTRPVRKLSNLTPPTVKDLVRRQTDSLSQRSARSVRSFHSRVSASSAALSGATSLRTNSETRQEVRSLVQDLQINTNAKGRLTVASL